MVGHEPDAPGRALPELADLTHTRCVEDLSELGHLLIMAEVQPPDHGRADRRAEAGQYDARMLVWMDLEMTGLDHTSDVIVEIATVITNDQLDIVAEGPDLVIHATDEQLAAMDPFVVEMHTRSGLLEQIKASTITLEEAGAATLEFIKQHVPEERSVPLCGNSIGTDRRFLDAYLPEIENHLHYRSVASLVQGGTRRQKWTELPSIALHFGLYLVPLFALLPLGMAFAFLGIQMAVFGVYMGASFAPNHKGMAIIPEGTKIDFLSKQVLTSRNVSGGWPMSILLGGLNYQIEHHLFPNMARPHLARAREITREHCASLDLPYTEATLFESYGLVIQYLNRVGLAARDPFDCPERVSMGR